MRRAYYMLIASLPYLPHFTRAERLPINPQRLRWRLSAMHPSDAAQLDVAVDLLHWHRQPLTRSGAEVDRLYRRMAPHIENAALREFVEYSLGERSILAALRHRHAGAGPPPEDVPCGVGRWEMVLRRRWDRDDFGLGALFPWIARGRQLLLEGEVVSLEELLMEAAWARLSQIESSRPFGFEAVFAYVFKWDILNRWTSHDRQGAAMVFTNLVEEVIGEQRSICA